MFGNHDNPSPPQNYAVSSLLGLSSKEATGTALLTRDPTLEADIAEKSRASHMSSSTTTANLQELQTHYLEL